MESYERYNRENKLAFRYSAGNPENCGGKTHTLKFKIPSSTQRRYFLHESKMRGLKVCVAGLMKQLCVSADFGVAPFKPPLRQVWISDSAINPARVVNTVSVSIRQTFGWSGGTVSPEALLMVLLPG